MSGVLFCAKCCLCDTLHRLTSITLLVCALSAAGFYAYQNVAMEFYYSWPYACMGASSLTSLDLEDASTESEQDSCEISDDEMFVEDYRILVEHDGIMKETMLHGISDSSQTMMDLTVFNVRSLNDNQPEQGGVLIDKSLAKSLRATVSDEIHLIQRVSGADVPVRVLAIVPTYAPTQDIVASNDSTMDMKPCSLSIYANSTQALMNCAAWAERERVVATVQTREEACQSAKAMAQKFLPFARSDALQIAALFISTCAFLVLAVSITHRQSRQFLQPALGMGLCVRRGIYAVALEMAAIAVFTSFVSGAIAVVLLRLIYSFPLSGMLFLSTFALLLGGSLAGGLFAVFGLWIRLRNGRVAK